jgi:hypothetical protein
MPRPHIVDKIENWVSDFVMSDGVRAFPGALREIASDILVHFLAAACEAHDLDPAEIEEPDLKRALQSIARLDIPADLRPEVPSLCAALLTQLESDGRLSGGRRLGG